MVRMYCTRSLTSIPMAFSILSREDAISFGCTGGTGRASGWACDVRKRMPYGVYDKVDFKEIVYTEGDCFARYLVRMDEYF